MINLYFFWRVMFQFLFNFHIFGPVASLKFDMGSLNIGFACNFLKVRFQVNFFIVFHLDDLWRAIFVENLSLWNFHPRSLLDFLLPPLSLVSFPISLVSFPISPAYAPGDRCKLGTHCVFPLGHCILWNHDDWWWIWEDKIKIWYKRNEGGRQYCAYEYSPDMPQKR